MTLTLEWPDDTDDLVALLLDMVAATPPVGPAAGDPLTLPPQLGASLRGVAIGMTESDVAGALGAPVKTRRTAGGTTALSFADGTDVVMRGDPGRVVKVVAVADATATAEGFSIGGDLEAFRRTYGRYPIDAIDVGETEFEVAWLDTLVQAAFLGGKCTRLSISEIGAG